MRRVPGGFARLALSVAAVAAAAGCAADPVATPLPGGPAPAGSTASVSTSATPTGAPVPATVVRLQPLRSRAEDTLLLDGYRRFWTGLAEAYRTGRTAALVEATVDPARRRFVRRATELTARAQTQRGTVVGSPLVIDLARGVVADCMDLRDFRTYDRSGRALYPRDAGTTRVRATLRAVGGRWRLADFETEGSGCRR
jgi:hypothetical protein